MSGSLSPSQRERFNLHGYFILPDISPDILSTDEIATFLGLRPAFAGSRSAWSSRCRTIFSATG